MRAVVYDPEDLAPLTVIDVPQSFVREIEEGKRGPFLKFAIQEEVSAATWRPDDSRMQPMRVAEVRFERFYYANPRGERVMSWMLMAMNPEICLLMKADFLPGQRKEVQSRERDAFMRGLVAAFGV